MKKMLLLSALAMIAVSFVVTGCAKQEDIVIEEFESQNTAAVKDFKVFNIYTDKSSPGNHYIPSGWMGDFSDIKINDRCMDDAHSATTCVKVEYLPRRSQGAG